MPATQFIIPYPVVAKPTNVGAPGARAYFYAPGTTTLVPIYASSALTTLLTNPVVADGAGRFPDIYLVTGTTYKLVLTDKSGAVLYNQDPYIPGTAPDASALQPYQTAAEAAAANSANSATAAATSETNAGNSATAAASSESNAATSASAASASATAAGNAATAVTTSIADIPNATAHAATRTALAVLGTSAPAYLREPGREGTFVFDPSDLSAQVAADTAQGIHVAPSSDPTGASGAWVRQFDGAVNPLWFGFVDGDDAAKASGNAAASANMLTTLGAIRATYATAKNNAIIRIAFPPDHVFWIGDSGAGAGIDLTFAAIIEGDSPGYNAGAAPLLKFPAGVTGIRTQGTQTSGANVKDAVAHSGALGTVIRNLALRGSFATTEAEAHGIQARTTTVCEYVAVENFEGDGFHFVANSSAGTGGDPPYGNVNASKLIGCTANENRCGFRFHSIDANACAIIAPNANNNRQAGIFDSSLIGNAYSAGQLATNGVAAANDGVNVPVSAVSDGTYQYFVVAGQEAGAAVNAPSGTATDNAYWAYWKPGGAAAGIPLWFNNIAVRAGGMIVAPNLGAFNMTFVGMYAEADQPLAQIWQYMLVIGGNLAGSSCYQNPAPNTGTALIRGGASGLVHAEPAFETVSGQLTIRLGSTRGNSPKVVWSVSDPTNSPNTDYLHYYLGNMRMDYAQSDSSVYYWLTGPTTADQFGTGAAYPYAFYASSLMVGGNSTTASARTNARRLMIDTVAPTTGAHAQGEFVFYRGASTGLLGWTCVTAGTPGTWEAIYTGFGKSPIGYATGAGGAVTQATSRTTGVTLNRVCGVITLVSAAGSATYSPFTVTNSTVAATDVIEVSQQTGANLYNVLVTKVAAGSFQLSVSAVSGTATEAPVINFTVIKAVNA